MASSVVSFAYFTHISNLNNSGTNADIFILFLFFYGILCDMRKKN